MTWCCIQTVVMLVQGREWFELTPESCDLIGFHRKHAKGSLWRLLSDLEEGGDNVPPVPFR
jgi:hypothetical protein